MNAPSTSWLTPEDVARVAALVPAKGVVMQIAEEVAAASGLSVRRIMDAGRADHIGRRARNMVWTIAHRRAGLSLGQIARVTGHDHSTVFHGIKLHEADQ